MRILALSCHEVLEADEVSLWRELGHEVFSPGPYVEPGNEGRYNLRPKSEPITDWEREQVDRWEFVDKDNLPIELVNSVDATIVMHLPKWIENNRSVFKNKRVVWRTIGQSISSVEYAMSLYRKKGLKIVRYSPRERNIPYYIGEDTLIRFYKDPEIYKGWTGEILQIINFTQLMKQRNDFCGWNVFNKVTEGFERKLYGPGNDDCEFSGGTLKYGEMLDVLRANRVYFYHGTYPASYTLSFIESFMLGIPIVAVGPAIGNNSIWANHDLYEIPTIIENGVSGFWSDDIEEMRSYVKMLFESMELAASISSNARKKAVSMFNKDTARILWGEFLESLS